VDRRATLVLVLIGQRQTFPPLTLNFSLTVPSLVLQELLGVLEYFLTYLALPQVDDDE
jgi:hypothetical protein